MLCCLEGDVTDMSRRRQDKLIVCAMDAQPRCGLDYPECLCMLMCACIIEIVLFELREDSGRTEQTKLSVLFLRVRPLPSSPFT